VRPSKKLAPDDSVGGARELLEDKARSPVVLLHRRGVSCCFLDVGIEVELVAMRAHPDGIGFHFFLVIDPEFNEFRVEHVSFEKEVVIFVEFAD
jgi:hypothetical protein